MSEQEKQQAQKVQGCVSQVWLLPEVKGIRFCFRGDSDAHIVRGLVAVLTALFSGQTPEVILALDAKSLFAQLELDSHLTPQRSNGLAAMTAHIRAQAAELLQETNP